MTIATVPRIPLRAKKLIKFLNESGGIDCQVFEKDGKPDMEAARNYAEKLREIHKGYVGEIVTIEQSYNKVVIKVV
jgi:hypothetical protein